MRITRAYTITPEVKRILDTKVNKSDYVCRAVSKLHAQQGQYNPTDLPDMTLVGVLQQRYHEDVKLGGILATLRTLLLEKL